MSRPTLPPCPDAAPCWQLRLERPAMHALRLHRDFARELARLRAAVLRNGCAVHAYALLPARLDLLVSGLLPGAVSSLLRDLTRTGTAMGPVRPWQARCGRRISHRDVLAAMRAIDMAPVTAGLASDPRGWAWSSHRACTQGARDVLACPHAAYLGLARSRGERRRRYRGYDPGTPGHPALPA